MTQDDPLWQQIVADNAVDIPEGEEASDTRQPFYKPFRVRERVLCYVPSRRGCDACVANYMREETDGDDVSCHHMPVCSEGHFEVFTPEHYALLVASEMNGGNDA